MLELADICKAYNNTPVIDGAQLRLKPGQCIGLAGKNGSGKSTLLRIIAQIIPPDSGDILEGGRSVLRDREFLRQSVGYVPQSDALAPFLTVEQQLKFWQRAVGSKYPPAQELLGLDELLKKKISELSGGQRKRLSIALAMQSSPRYLIMDEAFSSLDSQYRAQVSAWLSGRIKDGGAVIWCSHDLGEIDRLCQSCFLLLDGKLQHMSVAEAAGILLKTR